MPNNESRANRPQDENTETETVKPSKLSRVKSASVTAAWIIIPTAVTGAMTYVGYKTTKMNLETAKLTLEAAKVNKLTDIVPPKS